MNNSFSGKRVLITGGMGFIGSSLAHALVKLKARVSIIDLMLPMYGGNFFNLKGIEDKCKIVTGDIAAQPLINRLVRNQDFIFSLAGQGSHVGSLGKPLEDLRNNCQAQLALLEACRKHNPDAKIIFSGTRGQYGKYVYLPVDEEHPMKPIDINGINKTAAESYYSLYHKNYGLRTVSLRLTNTYGPRQQMRNFTQGFLNLFIRSVIDGKDIKIFGEGKQIRDFNFIDDVVSAFLMSAASEDSEGRTFNLGSNAPISVIDVAKMVIDLHGSGRIRRVSFPEEYMMTEVGDYVSNNTKIRDILGWKPGTALKDGLRKTIDYYKKYKRNYWR